MLASERSVSGFLEALHRGSSYGSTGLTFSKLGSEGDVIVVTAPGAARLTFIGRSATILLQVDGEGFHHAPRALHTVAPRATPYEAAGSLWTARS